MSEQPPQKELPLTLDHLAAAEQVAGLEFTAAERELMQQGVNENLERYHQLRQIPLPNDVAPVLRFDPLPPGIPRPAANHRPSQAAPAHEPPALPTDPDDLAFLPLTELARLIESRQVTSLALTELYLERLKRYDPQLKAVITLTEETALAQARQADAEIAAGRYRGPLHGIPWGAKDLLATRNAPTTWGATPYRNQVIDQDATVVQRLAEAGAVLAAKLSLGALAWGDVWFGGRTNSPWNLAEGSSGSSAGSAAATAAGLVGFAIGSETWGSIVSPATQCGLSGLRPTFGRVSRHGAMALSWSMDKLGPLARSAADCALVFAAIHGPDGLDPTAVERPFPWPVSVDLSGLRIGVVESEFEKDYNGKENDAQTLEVLRSLGVELAPISLPDYPLDAMQIILGVEAAAAFDELTRSNRDDLLVRQVRDAWPNIFRQARLIPAVEYIQANRVRGLLMGAMARLMETVDLYLAPSFCDNLLLTNLTGHPAVVLPNGMGEKELPTSITFTGRCFDESTLLAVAQAYQAVTDFHRRRPPFPPR